jgi:hypothetical protein
LACALPQEQLRDPAAVLRNDAREDAIKSSIRRHLGRACPSSCQPTVPKNLKVPESEIFRWLAREIRKILPVMLFFCVIGVGLILERW